MPLMLGAALLIVLYILWKLFVDGWLFKIIIFLAGWVGLYYILTRYVEGSKNIALTFGHTSFTWAAVVSTFICGLVLITTRTES